MSRTSEEILDFCSWSANCVKKTKKLNSHHYVLVMSLFLKNYSSKGGIENNEEFDRETKWLLSLVYNVAELTVIGSCSEPGIPVVPKNSSEDFVIKNFKGLFVFACTVCMMCVHVQMCQKSQTRHSGGTSSSLHTWWGYVRIFLLSSNSERTKYTWTPDTTIMTMRFTTDHMFTLSKLLSWMFLSRASKARSTVWICTLLPSRLFTLLMVSWRRWQTQAAFRIFLGITKPHSSSELN